MNKRRLTLLHSLAVLALVVGVAPAAYPQDVTHFDSLPKPEPGFPEGIAADRAGRIYVATFDFTTENVIYALGRDGQVAATISLPGVTPLGMQFDARGHLYVANFGGGNILRFRPPFTSGSIPDEVYPVCGGAGAGCGLNAIAFDARGDLYVSDSFGGKIFRVSLPKGAVSEFLAHDLLKPGSHGFPPFGANGLAFDAAGANLYVANTADDRILKYEIATRAVSVFAESVNGADGLAFDANGLLWVAANQADEVVAVNAKGRVVERRGAFGGIGEDGAPKGLLFPASIVLSGGSIYVTNLALPLTPPVGDEPEEDVTTFTVSRVPLNPE
jgi:sugar lactone lactonase YvrE